MESAVFDRIRNKLREQCDLIAPYNLCQFPWRLRQFWHLLRTNDIWNTKLAELEQAHKDVVHKVSEVLSSDGNLQETLYYDVVEQAAASLAVIRFCLEKNPNPWRMEVELKIGKMLEPSAKKLGESLEHFKSVFIMSLYSYLDDQISDQYLLLYFLIRYKQLCEWFDRRRLHEIYESSPTPKEDYLALDAYRFLFLEGMEFHLSPNSMIGKIDFISEIRDEGRLLFDAKIYRSGRTGVAKGFNQLQSYLTQYNQNWGCLLIFDVNKESPLGFDLPTTDFQIPYMEYGGKTIFMVVIDIAERESASERGKLKPLIMNGDHLIEEIDKDNTGDA